MPALASPSNRQFQAPRPPVNTSFPQAQHQQYLGRQNHNPLSQPSYTPLAKPTLPHIPKCPPPLSQTQQVIPASVHKRLEMYVSQLAKCQANVDILSQKADTATEPNTNLQQGHWDIRANLTKLEENVVTLLEKHEGLITDDHLGSSYQQICDSINWLNEQMTKIEPRCLLFFIEPEMSSHYFRNAVVPDFFVTVHQSPGFFKATFLLRDQMRANRAQDRFYFALLERKN